MYYDTELTIQISDRAKRIRFLADGLLLVDEALVSDAKFTGTDWRTITFDDMKNMSVEQGDIAHEYYLLAQQRKKDIIKALTSTLRKNNYISPSSEA